MPDMLEIVRVDVDDDGVLVLTAVAPEGTRWFTHDDSGLVERFPERDAKLPLAARLQASEDWRVLSYRPGRRMVVLARRGERVDVLKGHRKSRSARAVVRQGFAERAMRRGAFRVPCLLQHDREHEALVFEYLTGREVELGAESAPLYARLGERLAVFQGDGVLEGDVARDLEAFGPSDELEVLERWKGKVLQVVGHLPPGWPEARVRLAQCAAPLPAPRLGLCHRDLHDRQVHLDGAGVALLDFDLLCRADVALDPGNLVAHLRWRALQGLHGADESSARALEGAFLAGLGREREPGFEARLAFYTVSALLRLALVYRLRPRWSSRVGELVALASAVLNDRAPFLESWSSDPA
jgi:phosphotransferase family enzyme